MTRFFRSKDGESQGSPFEVEDTLASALIADLSLVDLDAKNSDATGVIARQHIFQIREAITTLTAERESTTPRPRTWGEVKPRLHESTGPLTRLGAMLQRASVDQCDVEWSSTS